MRHLPYALLVAVVAWTSMPVHAQEKRFQHPRIEKVRVGFQPFQDADPSAYKAGLWTPVHIQVFGGTEGININPKLPPLHLEIECPDNEDVGTRINLPLAVEPLKSHTVTGYVKTGNRSRDVTVRLCDPYERPVSPPRPIDAYTSLEIDAHLYVTLGSRITDLRQAVGKIGKKGDDKEDWRFESGQRRVAFETEVERLPERWFGYSGVDLIVLSTEKKSFLDNLRNSDAQLEALAKWVRRGGRLVIPVQWKTQDALSALLSHKTAWQPPIPVVPPKDAGNAAANGVKRLTKVEEFGHVRGEPFYSANPPTLIPIAALDPGRVPPGDWEFFANTDVKDGSRPLIARVRYGLGQIVYLAFSFEDTDFFNWNGKEQFLQTLVKEFAPRSTIDAGANPNFVGRGNVPDDLTTNLVTQLDNFDITVVKFGYVALFIILYILVVGPLDFVLLKYVFKRLEWTWVTFPSVVLGVSIVAYFTAYALKGRDLKINKVDIVDFDLRTDVDGNRQQRSVHAYGQSFFTILSPRIQNYTVGLEPNPKFWGAEVRKIKLKDRDADEVLSVDSLTWTGRPSGGPHDMGRRGSSGFFRSRYTYRDDGSGLDGVPIPVWTTKSFAASWEQRLPKNPFKVNLVHHHKKDLKNVPVRITGQLENHLGVDLTDVWLIFRDRAYPIADGLKRATPGAAPPALTILEDNKIDLPKWAQRDPMAAEPPEPRAWSGNPSALIKQILFHQKIDTQGIGRNHLLRPLDLAWRVDVERGEQRDRSTREAILYARVAFVSGNAESVTANQTLPTKLWLGDLPEDDKARPGLVGILNQDTFIRVILPVRPAEE